MNKKLFFLKRCDDDDVRFCSKCDKRLDTKDKTKVIDMNEGAYKGLVVGVGHLACMQELITRLSNNGYTIKKF